MPLQAKLLRCKQNVRKFDDPSHLCSFLFFTVVRVPQLPVAHLPQAGTSAVERAAHPRRHNPTCDRARAAVKVILRDGKESVEKKREEQSMYSMSAKTRKRNQLHLRKTSGGEAHGLENE